MPKKGTRFVKRCIMSSIIFILVDISVLGTFFLYSNFVPSKKSLLREDLFSTYYTSSNSQLPLYLFDSQLISFTNEIKNGYPRKKPVLVGLDATYLTTNNFSIKVDSVLHFLKSLEKLSFKTGILYNHQLLPGSRAKGKIPVTLIWKRFSTFQCLILYSREDNTWWFGNLMDDPKADEKLANLELVKTQIEIGFEGILNKVEFVSKTLHESNLNVLAPKYSSKFLRDLSDSLFIDCNTTRADIFKQKFYKNSTSGQRFKHRAWKLLARAKTILDRLSVKFWLSSGTCLGYYRECDFIPHSLDVDIGIFAKDYISTIVPEMELHGLSLKHWFGTIQDSLELSFTDKNGLKLDIFFFYDEGDSYWNGGTQARTGRKFKYSFPKFKLCWTIFRELKVRIPCDTHSYIVANYGPNWYIPISKWDWKESPPNVQPNGIWPKNQWSEVIKINM